MRKIEGSHVDKILVDGNEIEVCVVGIPLPARVWVNPASGDTISVWFSPNNKKKWVPWPLGPVNVYTDDELYVGVTHLKYQRTGGSGTTSTCGVCA